MPQHDPEAYVLIKRWVPEYEQELLWEHTRRIREDRDFRVRRVELGRIADDHKAARVILARKKSQKRAAPGIFDFLAPRR